MNSKITWRPNKRPSVFSRLQDLISEKKEEKMIEVFTVKQLSALSLLVIGLVIAVQTVPAQRAIGGTVFSENQVPLDQVIVELLDELERPISFVQTSRIGTYNFIGLQEGIYFVRLRVKGYKPELIRTETNQGQVDIHLQRDTSADGIPAFAPGIVFAQNIPPDARKTYTQALKLFKKKKLDEGMSELKKSVIIYPDYFEALRYLGSEYVRSGQFAEAEAVLSRAAVVNPHNAQVMLGLGGAQYKLGKMNEALRSLEKSLELNPASVNSNLLAGIIFRELKRFDESERYLLKAGELSRGRNPDVHWNLALLYFYDLKRFAAAANELESYLKAYRNDPAVPYEKKELLKKLIKILQEKAEQN